MLLEWAQRLMNGFVVTEKGGEIFDGACFAGRYAGVSEVFKVTQRK